MTALLHRLSDSRIIEDTAAVCGAIAAPLYVVAVCLGWQP